jgi:hypothetical protein
MVRLVTRLSDLGLLPAALLVAAALSTGCGREIVKAPNPIEIGAGSYDRVFAATTAELRDEDFVINRQDYRFGVINTRPMLSPTILEPWEQINSTMYQSWESTFNTERRTVTVTLEPLGAIADTQPADNQSGRAYLLRVEVLVERLESPVRQLTGSTVNIATNLTGLPESYNERGIGAIYWMPFNHDPYMEQELIAAILRRAAAPVPDP